LIDLGTSNSRTVEGQTELHKKVPHHMNYVAVEWPGGGYAHVVENEDSFNEDFCLDILCGYFEDVPYHMKRRQKSDSSKDIHKIKEIKEKWDPYDWVAYACMNESSVP
jgi:hypothetical protein